MSGLILRGTWRDGVFGDHVVWSNPPELGHVFIKLRKQRAQDRIIERMEARRAGASVVAAIIGGERLE